jgi:signal transduction histidine kinase/CheY-like chemotaxis protein
MALVSAEPDGYSMDDLRRLRLAAIPYLLVLQYVAAVALILVPFPLKSGRSVALGIAFVAVAICVYVARHFSVRLAGLLLIGSWFGLWVVLLWLAPDGAAAWLAVLVVGAGSALFGPWAALGTSALTTTIILFVTRQEHLPSGVTLVCVLVTWFAAVLFWLTARPITTFLGWAWASYVDARNSRDQLRERQGELNRALKSLEIAYNRLEHLNDELSRARRAAEEAQRFKSQFAASLSHELRTPLNLIIGFSEMMVAMPHTYSTTQLPASYQVDIAAIYHNAHHLAGLIDDVLDLSQIEAGRMGLAREWTDISAIVEEAVRAIAIRLETLGLSVDIALDQDLPSVYVDRTRIRQVLINLLNNAARFTDQGGIRIRTQRSGNELVVSVEDTGIGISPEDLPHVFDEFFKANSLLQRRVGGSGLGLTISKRLVELHGGSMWAESQRNVGSTFSFSLPLLERVVTGTLPGEWEIWDRIPSRGEPDKPLLALVTEDDEVFRAFQRHLDGYTIVRGTMENLAARSTDEPSLRGVVLAAPTPEDCWRALGEAPHTDLGLPIAVVAIPGTHARAANLGVAQFVTKPISRDKLGRVLGQLGRRARTILVADDNVDMVRLLARMIRSFGRKYRVLQATGGEEALQIMVEQKPDAVLLDLLMPDVDGYAVVRAMQADERLRDIVVVAMTAGTTLVENRTIELVGFTRSGGLSTDEMMRCLESCFHVVQPARLDRNEQEPRASPSVEPASATLPLHPESAQELLHEAPSRRSPEHPAYADRS